MSNWTADDIRRKEREGGIPEQSLDMFANQLPASVIPGLMNKKVDPNSGSERELTIWIPAMKDKDYQILNPIPKQSIRMTVQRYRSSGTHSDALTGSTMHHKKGDVIIFQNKRTKLRDVILVAYPNAKVEKWEKHIADIARSSIPFGFMPYEKWVHVLKLHFIFAPLKSMTKKEIRYINEGNLIEKNTKPDLSDNLPKAVFDALEGIIFKNDSLVSRILDVGKFYGKTPGVLIELKGM